MSQLLFSIGRAVLDDEIGTLRERLLKINGINLERMYFYICASLEEISIQNFIECVSLYGKNLFTMEDGQGYKLLHNIIMKERLDLLVYSLSLGVNVNEVDGTRETPLHVASRTSTCITHRLLQQKGIIVDSQDEAGSTPLYLAIINRKYDVCLLLLDAQANPNIRDRGGESPFDTAAKLNPYFKILTLLADYEGMGYDKLYFDWKGGKDDSKYDEDSGSEDESSEDESSEDESSEDESSEDESSEDDGGGDESLSDSSSSPKSISSRLSDDIEEEIDVHGSDDAEEEIEFI